MRKASKIILLLLGGIIFFVYAMPLVAGILNAGNAFGMGLGLFLLLFGFLFERLGKAIISVVCILAIIGTSLFSFTLINVVNGREDAKENQTGTLIVLGCKVNGEAPSLQLYKRAKVGAEYLKAHPNEYAILCGGKGSDEQISEAECIKRVMLDEGIDESRLFIEDKSTSTFENLSFAKDILYENNLEANVVIVSSDYHCYRAKLIAKRVGLNANSIPAYADRFSLPTFYTREVFGVWLEYIKG